MKNNDILQRMQALTPRLPKSQKLVAQYILQNPAKVTKMTVSQLAQAAQSSTTSVIRLCQSLHIESFTQLKLDLATARPRDQVTELEIEPNEDIASMKAKLLAAAYQSMQDTMNYLHEDKLVQVNQKLQEAKNVYVFGAGASHLVAYNIAQKWMRIGKTFICDQDPHIVSTRLACSPQDTVLFLVSNSGETQDCLRLLDIAKRYGVPVISLTQFGENHVAKQSDLALQTVISNESKLRSAATSSLHAQFMAVDVLFYHYMATQYDRALEMIQTTKEAIHMLNQS